MTQKVDNLRVKRTKILLREALIALIEEKGFDALTVGDVTERAMVSRAAFYRNYQDKYALVEQIFEEAMNMLLSAVAEMGPPRGQEHHPPEVWVCFFEHIAEYERLYHALLGNKGSPWFVRKMRASLADLVTQHGREHVPREHPASGRPVLPSTDEFVPALVSAMLVEAITWWLEQGRPCTPREMATRCGLLMSALFREVSTWH